jgi:Ion transport protein
MMLWDDDRTLQYILKHKNISSVISHPVVSTFIELKYSKYKMLFRINFWFFLFLFVIPFSLFIFYESNEISFKLYATCVLSIAAFSVKEFVQYRIAKSPMNYLKDLTNKIDIPLLFLSCFLLAAFAFDWSPEVQSLLEVFFIFVMTWDAMTMLPIEDVSRTLQIIKKVIMTFVKVFCSFALIILAFAFSFRILFGAENLGPRNSTVDETEREPNMRNFEGIITTFVKVLVMMAGEYTIEPSKLKWYQLALFGIFVVFSFILFNLLLGMSIEDIQNLREDSLQRDLERKARKFIETNDKFEEIYAERT